MFYKCLFIVLFLFLSSTSCRKRKSIAVIPTDVGTLVVDGCIETGLNPIVLLSQSSSIYSPTDLSAFLENYIYSADVKIVNQSDTFNLELKAITNLDTLHQKKLAEMLGLKKHKQVLELPIFIFSTDMLIGEVNQDYELIVNHNAKSYSGITQISGPTALESLYWDIEPQTIEYGYSWAQLKDQAGQYDAYKWEVKRLNLKNNGKPKDDIYMTTRDAYFDDTFFDGLTFDFPYENPMPRRDSTHLSEFKRMYRLGDTVVVKFSKLDKATYSFFKSKASQVSNGGNPFATPINIPSNMNEGALGVWAGYSPHYDTLYCYP